jgi:FMN phosphatase YigB (HAD superfamily)
MIIIFDLDYTLLDTVKLRRALAKILKMSIAKYNATSFKDGGSKYNFLVHLNKVAQEKQLDKKKCLKELNHLLANLDSCLFKSSANLVKKLANNNQLILLTHGNKKWQKMKVDNLKIKKYFNQILITDDCKSKSLLALSKKPNKIFFVNDNAKECVKIKKMYPKINIVLIKSKYSQNVSHSFKEYNLKKLLTYKFE